MHIIIVVITQVQVVRKRHQKVITKDKSASFTQARVCYRSAMRHYFKTTRHIRNIFQKSAMETVQVAETERLTHLAAASVTSYVWK